MVITPVLASPQLDRAAAAQSQGGLGVALYHVGRPALAGIGHRLPDEIRKQTPRRPSVRAWDFLSIALAVYGADRFIARESSPEGWTRIIALVVEVAEPDPWSAQAARLAEALRFLSGDIWYLRFRGGGAQPPDFPESLTDRNCACLFSGGLDSLIGAVDLVAAGRRPILVSQASPKETPIQEHLAGKIEMGQHRLEGHVDERLEVPYEPSSRSRSLLFFALGALVAVGLGGDLFVPENGLISINPALTRRRIGSLSTRTTHPHFVSSIQNIFDRVDLGVRILTPYSHQTKGEMLAQCASLSAIEEIASASYSCGKGKRLNKHCGLCIPCLVRRAAFHKAGVADSTVYASTDLASHGRNDDVWAARLAAAELDHRDIARWTAETGPLPIDFHRRQAHIDVVRRGLQELRDFLNTVVWL